MERIYLHPLLFRWLLAFVAGVAALVSPIGAVLGIHQVLRARITDLLPGLFVGLVLFVFFAYLGVRALRLGVVLTNDTVRLRGPLWDTSISINQIASISEEEGYDEGTKYTYYAARNEAGRQLFQLVGSKEFTECAHEIQLAIQAKRAAQA